MNRRDFFKYLMRFMGVSVVASAIPQTHEADSGLVEVGSMSQWLSLENPHWTKQPVVTSGYVHVWENSAQTTTSLTVTDSNGMSYTKAYDWQFGNGGDI